MRKLKLLLIFSFLMLSCTQTRILGYNIDDFLTDIKKGDWSKIDSLSLADVNLKSLKALETWTASDGAAYFIALRRYNIGDFANYEILMSWQMKQPESSFTILAAEHLAAYYTEHENWDRLGVLGNDPEVSFSSPDRKEQYRMTALYRQERSGRFAEILLKFPEHPGMTEESRLYRLVALFQTGDSRFQAKLAEYILGTADDTLLYRLYLYMLSNNIDIADQTPSRNLVLARLLSAAEEYKAAAFLYKKAWEEHPAVFLDSTRFGSLADTLLEAGEHDLFRTILKGLAAMPSASAAMKAVIYWKLGSMERSFSNYSEAAPLYEYIYRHTAGRERKRALWYWYDCLAREDDGKYLSKLPYLFSGWDDPSYFSDTFEYYSSWLLRTRDFAGLYAFYELVKDKADVSSISRLVWIMYLLDFYHYYPMPAGLKAELSIFMTDQKSGLFYRMVYNVLNGDSPELYDYGKEPAVEQGGENGKMVRQLMMFRLLPEAWEYAKREKLVTPLMVRLGVLLGEDREYYKSLRILIRASGRNDFSPDSDMLKALYPLAYSKEIAAASQRNNIPRPLFFGLIRAESLFNSEIGSYAGAQGLSQLMPATADEVAEKLSLGDYDIFDPETNLSIGGWYLANVRKRNNDYSRALYAYNAGPGKVDGWNGEIGDFPSLLYLESVPFNSTRGYVRKIFVSAQLYNYLYFDYDAQYIAGLFFSGFSDLKFRKKETS